MCPVLAPSQIHRDFELNVDRASSALAGCTVEAGLCVSLSLVHECTAKFGERKPLNLKAKWITRFHFACLRIVRMELFRFALTAPRVCA